MINASVSAGDADLVTAFQEGDLGAARELHDQFSDRLMALVRRRLNPVFQPRMDPEDVVQSAFRSFFRVLGKDDYAVTDNMDAVWGLLASIAINKLRAKVRFHSAGKRSIQKEDCFHHAIDATGAPDTETVFVDELRRLFSKCSPTHHSILELLLEGKSVEEVAEIQGCSTRTVNRVIERAVHELTSRLV
jgi:RNA polymerase sigma factor (sigma-70 family)